MDLVACLLLMLTAQLRLPIPQTTRELVLLLIPGWRWVRSNYVSQRFSVKSFKRDAASSPLRS